jgi:hypothetical protein
MNHDTELETDLRHRLQEATEALHASPGLWTEAERRGRRRLRQRRMAAGAGTAVTLAAVVGGAMLLTPPPVIPTIDPAAPGDTAPPTDPDLSTAQTEAEAQARAEAELARRRAAELEAQRREAEAGNELTDLEAAEQARREAERDAVEALRRALEERATPVEPLPPITGYGDHSDVSYFDLDHYAVTHQTARCLLDAGFDIELLPPGDGIAFLDTDPDRLGLAQATAAACRAGLNLPSQAPPTSEQEAIVYAYQLALHQCLTDAGLRPTAPPSLEALRSGSSWTAYDDLVRPDGPLADPTDFDAIQMLCPQQPVGGFGNWTPGDTIQPVEQLPDLDR